MSRRSIALLALALAPALALAQAVSPDARVPLSTGFVPDPTEIDGHAVGARALSEIAGSTCTGFVGDHASHVLSLNTRFGFLRVFATSDTDLVLGVRSIDQAGEEHWSCSDDRFGTSPSVEGVFPRGTLEVWVGTHTLGASGDYQLRMTEMRSVRPGVGTGGTADDRGAATDLGLDTSATGRFDPIRLHRGFLPDPRWLTGEARVDVATTVDAGVESGPIEVTLLGNGCGGLVQAAPAHIVTLLDDIDFLQIYLCAPADEGARCAPTQEPLSIVVLGPSGDFLCESASGSYAALERGPGQGGWPAGDYRVWIGVHHVATHQSYRMGISELRRVN